MNNARTINACSIKVEYGEFRVTLSVDRRLCGDLLSLARAGVDGWTLFDHGDDWACLMWGPAQLHGIAINAYTSEIEIVGAARVDEADRLDGTMTPTKLSLQDRLDVATEVRRLLALADHPVLPYVRKAA